MATPDLTPLPNSKEPVPGSFEASGPTAANDPALNIQNASTTVAKISGMVDEQMDAAEAMNKVRAKFGKLNGGFLSLLNPFRVEGISGQNVWEISDFLKEMIHARKEAMKLVSEAEQVGHAGELAANDANNSDSDQKPELKKVA